MSIDEVVLQAVLAAVHEIIDKFAPDSKADYLDATAERLKFDAMGQRKLDARRKNLGSKP